MKRYYIQLGALVILLGLIIWVNLPSFPGIYIGDFTRDMKTVLGLDLRGGVQVLLEADLPADSTITPDQMADAQRILENRTNALGVSENVFQVAGDRRIVGEFPGLDDPAKIVDVIKETGLLEFVDLGDTFLAEGTEVITDFGVTDTTPTTDQTVYHTIMTGDQLASVGVQTSKLGEPEIAFTLKTDGSATFAEFTTNNVGKYLAIVLDKKVISAPTISTAITDGQGVISGKFDVDSANALAIQMRYGSLPIPFKVVESRVIGPTLGQDSLNKSLIAGIVGFVIIILFMLIYYRVPGLAADLALVVYALLALTLFKLLPVTLTLPGIAGFLLSTGSALDANILIFERLKEELRSGRSFGDALNLAWKRAFPSIRDSNIATIITCVILFAFGSSFGATIVKGFAVTLFIGVIISLFCALVVTKTFLYAIVDRLKPTAKQLKLFGVLD
jgi:preprotein translocase subunit SecD